MTIIFVHPLESYKRRIDTGHRSGKQTQDQESEGKQTQDQLRVARQTIKPYINEIEHRGIRVDTNTKTSSFLVAEQLRITKNILYKVKNDKNLSH